MPSRTFLIGAGLAAGITIVTAAVPAGAQDFTNMPGVSISVEGLVLWRDDPGGTTYALPESATGFVAKESDFNPDAAAGIRAMFEFPAASLTGESDAKIQIGGLYAGDFSDQIGFNDPTDDTNTTYSSDGGGVVSAGLDGEDAEDIEDLRMKLETHLAGAEINYTHSPGALANVGSGIRALFGARYIYFGEELNGSVFDAAIGADDDIHQIRIDAENHLVGAQIGFEADHQIGSGVTVGGRLVGGLFANFINRDRRLVDEDTPGNGVDDSQSKTGFSQMVEFSPKIGFALTENTNLTLGGMVLWLNDVSDSSAYWSNMLNAGDSKIRDNESVLFYGVTAGVKINLN